MARNNIRTLFLLIPVCITMAVKAQIGVVTTQAGKVKGYRQENVSIFKGIPYAAPPVASLRWKAPQPVAAWKAVKECTAFSASPMQPAPVPFAMWTEEFIAPPKPLSEDCLYLNVWTSATSKHAKQPVFVWIYGGGFSSGSAGCAIYDGAEYAKQGVVFVSINYRVGVFGFLAHPALTKESGVHASGNYGLMDQLAALQWVKKNIAAFGGDPNNVTIAGQSAGSMSVHSLVASPLGKGLFQKAIAQSGGLLGSRFIASLQDAEKSGQQFQALAQATDLNALRALSADSVQKLSQKQGAPRFGPALDGHVLPADLMAAFRSGNFNQVPMLSGWVTGDGALFGNAKVAPDKFVADIKRQYKDKAGTLLALLPHNTEEEATAASGKLALLSFAGWPSHQLAVYDSKPVYVYEYGHVPPDKEGFPNYGAFHTSEVPFALHTLHTWKRNWRPVDYKMERIVSSYWINFIRTGNPNGKELAVWNVYNKSDGFIQSLSDPISRSSFNWIAIFDFMDANQ